MQIKLSWEHGYKITLGNDRIIPQIDDYLIFISSPRN